MPFRSLTFLLASGLALTAQGAPQVQVPAAAGPKAAEPFAFADFTWLNGNPRTKDAIFDSKYFTGEFRADVNAVYSFNHPQDHTLVGSCETGRTNEIQVQQLGLGGDFHWDNVRGRVMTQFGMYATMTPRNDSSSSRGQWQSDNAYRYLSEAYGGYHWDVMNGINLDAGIFMSYVGLFSYYNFDNWAYQPSYVSANTPWFFNGARLQVFPTDKLKVELWLINGWQSYNTFNNTPGIGASINWRPTGNLNIISNNYFLGADTLGNQKRTRRHTDNSIQWKYWDQPDSFISRMATTFTFDLGDEQGGGVSRSGTATEPKQYFAGWMLYNRFWFKGDRHAVTVGGGAITNPGRYLVLVPPVNGATATSGTPYFTANPGDPFHAWDYTVTYDYMPSQYITMRSEFNRRGASVPYFAGQGGVTPPGGNQGAPGSAVANWAPDLRKTESRINLALMVKF
ncbi:MAG TPA: outer membrane beta-barrel protein [Holophagaceae bacterium]|nr:outer membrane beta-barrel protein [Holophagaceae bacterium]